MGPGDITTNALVDPDKTGSGVVCAKEKLVVAGIDVAKAVFLRLDPEARIRVLVKDGEEASPGWRLMEVAGRLAPMLTAERTALNFLQRLSGIATWARSFAQELKDTGTQVADTRKTAPGWRVLEKYAVSVGGAANHRMGLFDGVLIKDNHVAVCGGVAKAVKQARQRVHHLVRVEVEVSDLAGVEQAIEAGADVILLDNMDLAAIKEAVALVNGRAVVEVSGRITKPDLKILAQAGVDVISCGAMTHSAPSVDINMTITADS